MIPYAPSTPYQRNATVADLMMQAGNQQAQAQLQKGAVWGRALGNIGDIASGAILDYQKQKRDAPLIEAELVQKRGQAALTQQQVMEGQKKQRLSDVLANQGTMASQGQDMTPESIASNLQQNGLGEYVPDVLRAHEETKNLVQSQFETTNHTLAGFADNLSRFVGKPIFGIMADEAANRLNGIIPGIRQKVEQLKQLPPEEQKQALDFYVSQSQTYQKQKAEEAKANRVIIPENSSIADFGQIGPDGKPAIVFQGKPKQDTRSLEVRLAEARLAGDTKTAEALKVAIAEAAAAGRAPKEAPKPGDNKDDVSFLMNGGTAEKLPISARAAAVAEAKKSGGVDGTGFVPMSGQQQNKFNDLMDLRNKAVRLSELLSNPEVSSSLGPFMGRVVDWTKELPGVGQGTTVKEAFDLFKDLSDSELRKRSGAAISPGEYQRILGFTVASSKQPDSNKTNLNRMISTLTRDLKTLGADKLRLPGEAEPLENGTRVASPKANPFRR